VGEELGLPLLKWSEIIKVSKEFNKNKALL
jgi:hypothetical protein